jgi:DtxR family Mn-dependent transcriptional regulator
VLRRHRLLELYLVQALGYTWDEVHEEAERLEHHISEKLEARIDAYLLHPTFDPHGDPIPAQDGSLPDRGLRHLSDLAEGDCGEISRLLDQSTNNLRYLQSKGLVLGVVLRVTRREPIDHLTYLEVHDTAQVIGEITARSIMVKPC